MKTHLVLVGFGQNRRHMIPALMSISSESPQMKVTIIDKRSFNSIIDEDKLLTKDQIKWCKERFLQEDGDREEDVNDLFFKDMPKMSKKDTFQRIFYLSIPLDAFESAIKKYSKYADIFVMEKPWALNQSHLQKIIESSSSSKILGVDHYLWKPEVRQFLKVMQLKFNLKLLQESDSFDFILCEPELDPKNRTYFWKTGVAIDMIPHILPLLDRLFDNCTTISIEKAVPAICDDTVVIDVLNNLENVSSELNSATPTAIKYTVKETFAEIILILLLGSGQRKLIHVVLGKGIIVPPILICSQTTQSQKFLYGSFGNIFLDLNNHNITLQCKKRASNETESPWYNIFKSLASRKYSQFVDIESIQKYVSLYPCILNKLNHSVNQITGKEYTSGYARLLINSNELRYSKGKKAPLLLKHPGCCFNNSRNINK